MHKFLFSILLFIITSCGTRTSNQDSALKIEINVPTSQINSASILNLLDALEAIHQSSSRGVLTLGELIAVIPFTNAELAVINQNRDDQATVTCSNLICTGTNSGNSLEINASQMNIPSIGVPHMRISSNIRFKFRMESKRILDICSIEGFSVKKLFLWSDIHAAQVSMNDRGQADRAIITASPTTFSRCQ